MKGGKTLPKIFEKHMLTNLLLPWVFNLYLRLLQWF